MDRHDLKDLIALLSRRGERRLSAPMVDVYGSAADLRTPFPVDDPRAANGGSIGLDTVSRSRRTAVSHTHWWPANARIQHTRKTDHARQRHPGQASIPPRLESPVSRFLIQKPSARLTQREYS